MQTLEPGSKIDLELKQHTRPRSLLSEMDNETERTLTVKMSELSYGVPLSRSSRRYLPYGLSTETREDLGVVADICNDFGFRSITFRGIVQIRNHFNQPIDLYYKTHEGVVKQIGPLKECGNFNVPLFALYTQPGELFFSPIG